MSTGFIAACPHKQVSSTTSFWTSGWDEPVVLCENCYFYHVSVKECSHRSSVPKFFSGVQASISSVWSRSQKLKRERGIVRSIKRCDYYEKPNCILPGQLYLGSQYSACHLETLRQLNISAVLVCGNSLPRFFMERPDSSIEYHKLPIHDSLDQPLLPYIHSAMQFLENNIILRNKGVLVHCAAGVSRSASMVIAYLMKHKRWDYDTARQFVWEKRPTINPNPRFEGELRIRWYPLCVPPDEDRENFFSLPRLSSLTPTPSVSDSISESTRPSIGQIYPVLSPRDVLVANYHENKTHGKDEYDAGEDESEDDEDEDAKCSLSYRNHHHHYHSHVDDNDSTGKASCQERETESTMAESTGSCTIAGTKEAN